jgi:hypothetical protein
MEWIFLVRRPAHVYSFARAFQGRAGVCGPRCGMDQPKQLGVRCEAGFLAMIRRLFYASIVAFLLPCLVSPFVEFSLHMNGTIFSTGKDTETSVALLIVLLGLALVITSLIVALQPALLATERIQPPARVLPSRDCWKINFPELSPPPFLRI